MPKNGQKTNLARFLVVTMGGHLGSGGRGEVDIRPDQIVEEIGSDRIPYVVWDIYWANFLFHEGFWHNAGGRKDDLNAPAGSLSISGADINTPTTMSAEEQKAVIGGMGLRYR